MKRALITLPLVAMAMAITGCQTNEYMQPETPIAKIPVMTISGSATYRERIALQPGMVYDVQLLDVSRADAPSTIIVQYTKTLNGEQVPLPFSLQVTQNYIKTNMRYVVRATLSTPDGRPAWTTDTAYPIDPTKLNQDIGMLTMVKVASSPPMASATQLLNTWQIEDIGGTGIVDRSAPMITFAGDGAVSGTTGCNRFAGTFKPSGSSITLSPLAVTQMACVPSLNDQESRMLSILNNLASWQVDAQGRLILTSKDTQTIVATKQ